jgi:hypothetical protein
VLGGGFFISAIGVYIHNLWLIDPGYGVLGGCGLGIGYISPVSTLIRWLSWPAWNGDRNGHHGIRRRCVRRLTALSLADSKFSTSTHVGIAETFIVLGIVYFIFMMIGSIIARVPAPGWKPAGYTPPAEASKLITKNDVFGYDAPKTPQFWLI